MTLSSTLKTGTQAQHERMHMLMARAEPFASRERYATFVAAQYLFQRDVAHLFADPAIAAVIPDLDGRGRTEASRADLADLATPVPQDDVVTSGIAMPEAIGWLYVSEGSTLGAAFLLKEVGEKLGLTATFGARNLAAYPEGRARAWKRFVEALDGPALAGLHDRVVAGANAAYDRFGDLLEARFALHAGA